MPTRRRPATTILLVRHGRTPTTGVRLPGRARGLHLDEAGQAEAARTAERIAAAVHVEAVYTSPLERARETARPIAVRQGLTPRVHRGLLECDYGDWTGAELAELRRLPAWRALQRNPSGFRFPNGESLVGMQARVVDALRGIAAAHPGGTVVAVSHADPIRAAVADAVGTHLDMFHRIVVGTASVTAVAYGTDGPLVLTLNAYGDLPQLGGRR
ncbi:MAG: phosphoglycerate mutase [Acidimicrobiia bacterium]